MKWAFSARNQPRNGIKLLAYLLDAGFKPDLYGFDLSDRGNNAHYYDNEIQTEGQQQGHKPSIEFKLLNELKEKGLINVY